MSDPTDALAVLLHRALIDADLVLVPTALHARSPGQQRQALAARLLAAGVTVSPPSGDLAAALEAAAEAMDIVRDGMDIEAPSAISIGAQSILRHAAREARATLATLAPDAPRP